MTNDNENLPAVLPSGEEIANEASMQDWAELLVERSRGTGTCDLRQRNLMGPRPGTVRLRLVGPVVMVICVCVHRHSRVRVPCRIVPAFTRWNSRQDTMVSCLLPRVRVRQTTGRAR